MKAAGPDILLYILVYLPFLRLARTNHGPASGFKLEVLPKALEDISH